MSKLWVSGRALKTRKFWSSVWILVLWFWLLVSRLTQMSPNRLLPRVPKTSYWWEKHYLFQFVRLTPILSIVLLLQHSNNKARATVIESLSFPIDTWSPICQYFSTLLNDRTTHPDIGSPDLRASVCSRGQPWLNRSLWDKLLLDLQWVWKRFECYQSTSIFLQIGSESFMWNLLSYVFSKYA